MIRRELRTFMEMLYSSTAAGSILENALKDAALEMVRTPAAYPILLPLLRKTVRGLDHHVPMETLLQKLGEECQSEDTPPHGSGRTNQGADFRQETGNDPYDDRSGRDHSLHGPDFSRIYGGPL